MDRSNRPTLVLLGIQITIFGALMALLAMGGLQYWSVELGIAVAAAGFVVSIPAVLAERR